jgi:hypothetical protein
LLRIYFFIFLDIFFVSIGTANLFPAQQKKRKKDHSFYIDNVSKHSIPFQKLLFVCRNYGGGGRGETNNNAFSCHFGLRLIPLRERESHSCHSHMNGMNKLSSAVCMCMCMYLCTFSYRKICILYIHTFTYCTYLAFSHQIACFKKIHIIGNIG